MIACRHQSGPIALMAEARAEIAAGSLTHLDLLTRCHQTPAYSQLHSHVKVTMLHCPPPGLPVLRDASKSTTCVGPLNWIPSQFMPRLQCLVDASVPYFPSVEELQRRFPQAPKGCGNECDCFFASPADAMATRYAVSTRQPWAGALRIWQHMQPASKIFAPLPSHIALFDELYDRPEVRRIFEALQFVEHRSFFHELSFDGANPNSSNRVPWRPRIRKLWLLRRMDTPRARRFNKALAGRRYRCCSLWSVQL